MLEPTPQYIAGVADSDGSFTLMKRKGQSTTTGYFYRSVFQLSWTPCVEAENFMLFLKKKYGGSFSICLRKSEFKSKHGTTLKYSVESKGLLSLIADIEPFLILKKDRASLIRKQIELRNIGFQGRNKPRAIWRAEDRIYLDMNKLNSKNKKHG